MRDLKIQWHPGFVAAMTLEFKEYKDILVFENEHNLNTKPLAIDLLIVKKKPSVHISDEIGEFFREHNILEYKSPEDHLNIDTFFKTLAYACLYKAYEKKLNEIKMDSITMSIVRETKPEGLFRNLEECGCTLSKHYNGIYYIKGPLPFPAQIIVTSELDNGSYMWLKALSAKLDKKDIQNLLDNIHQMSEKADKEMAASVLEISMEANKQIAEELKEGDTVFETLMEIMEPKINEIMESKINEIRKAEKKEGLKEGIQGTINVLRKLKLEDAEIQTMIMEQYNLTENEVKEYL